MASLHINNACSPSAWHLHNCEEHDWQQTLVLNFTALKQGLASVMETIYRGTALLSVECKVLLWLYFIWQCRQTTQVIFIPDEEPSHSSINHFLPQNFFFLLFFFFFLSSDPFPPHVNCAWFSGSSFMWRLDILWKFSLCQIQIYLFFCFWSFMFTVPLNT